MASSAILTLSTASAQTFTNELVNPGLETGALAPWRDQSWMDWFGGNQGSHNVSSTNGFVNGSTTIHEPTHNDSQYSLKVWGTYWGNGFWQEHTLSQWVPAAPGSKWSADVWGYTATPDDLKAHGQNYTLLEVTFCDASSNTLATAYSEMISATNSAVNTWIHLVATNSVDGTTNLEAPDGTAWVRFCLPFWQDPNQGGGSIYWDDANLIKTYSPLDPEISLQPMPLTVLYDQTATFTVGASGHSALSYQWQNNNGVINDGGRFSGATSATLTISNATAADQLNYFVTVTDLAGSATSSSALLTVLDPGIVTNPVSVQRIEGQSATFSVAAVGSGTLTYAWYNGANQVINGPRISGADEATLTISNLTAADSGGYYVIVTGAAQALSTTANLYVSTIAQASQLMRNPSFELGALDPSWTHWNGAGAETATGGEAIYDGTYCCGLWGTGADTWNGINQSFACAPGYMYRANAWLLVSATQQLSDAATAWLEINFYHNPGDANPFANYRSAMISTNSPAGVWSNLTVSAVAPAAARQVRCQINYHAGGGGGGIMYVDDVNFWLRIPVSVTPSVSGANLMLSFPTQPGVTNQVLYKNDLSDADWQTLETVVGDLSGQAAVPAPMDVPKRFYRVSTLW